MTSLLHLAKKELREQFLSPMAYMFLCVFLFIASWFYVSDVFLIGEASLRRYFGLLPMLFIIFIPAITMGSWAEEKRSGTWEFLLTLPMTASDLVLGKFLASITFLVLTLLATLPVVFVMSFLGDLDQGQIFASYLGMFFMGSCFLAQGLALSCLFKHQIVAFLVSVLFSFFVYILGEPLVTSYVPHSFVKIFQLLGLNYHLASMVRGVLDIRDILYFISFISLALTLNIIILKSRKTF